MLSIDKAEIKAKRKKLEDCAAYLKREFIGIDPIIDDLVDYLQVWYLMPEILSRPVIINLWGMTGVGKTDLVRKMVKFLGYQDRFAEVELSNTNESSYISTVAQVLHGNQMSDEKPGIVLFDEIQRFNTIDQEGNPVKQTRFLDFWELLSDGRLSKKTKEDLDSMLFGFMNTKRNNDRARARGEEPYNSGHVSIYDAMSIQSNLGLEMDVMEISELTEDDMIRLILEAKEAKKIYEPVDHSKTLIIISGNLDEAFVMASQTSEADIDADIYNAFTRKITVVDIKNALSRKFRPEQVARFGNIHLIYHSLRREDFEALIQKEIKRIKKNLKQKLGIKLSVGKAINKLIYRNGVFPVQGVRPVFSSVIDILESNLTKFMYAALMANADNLKVDYDKKRQVITAIFDDQQIEVPYVGRIDKIRQANLADTVANISVHECGHAVVYMELTEMAPLQLKSKVASSYAGGFTFPHQIHLTKSSMLEKVKIYLAGGIAEELIFGAENASVGRQQDREEATKMVIEYVRRFGFDEDFQTVYSLDANPLVMNHGVTDATIEKMMARLVSETKEMLVRQMPLLKALSKELHAKGSMEAAEIVVLAKKFGLHIKAREEGFLRIAGYEDLLGS